MISEWMPECVDRYTLRLVESAGMKRWVCSCDSFAATARCQHAEREIEALAHNSDERRQRIWQLPAGQVG